MVSEIHLGDIGTVFEVTIMDGKSVVNVSTATDITFHFKKPSGTLITKTGQFATNGSDGKVKYTTISGDLDELAVKGKTWKYQVEITLPYWHGKSDIGEFEVHPNL